MHDRGHPADVPAVAGREERQQPDRAVLGGMRGAGQVDLGQAALEEHVVGHGPPDRGGPQAADGQVERHLADDLSAGVAPLEVGHHLVGDVHLAQAEAAPAPVATLALGDHADVGDLAGSRRPVDVGARDDGDVVVEVEGLHQPGVAAVHVDRAGVRRGVRARLVDVTDHPPGLGLDEGDRAAAGRADVGEVGGPVAIGPEPAARPSPQPALVDQAVEQRRAWPGRTARGRRRSAVPPGRRRTGADPGRARWPGR